MEHFIKILAALLLAPMAVLHAAVAAREIKKRNPRAKVLFYWNASLDTSGQRGDYNAMLTFPADGFLKDSQGKPVLSRNTVPNYDLTRKDVRDWWTDAAAKAVRELGADGIYADALGQDRTKGMSDEQFAALVATRVALLEETRRSVPWIGTDGRYQMKRIALPGLAALLLVALSVIHAAVRIR